MLNNDIEITDITTTKRGLNALFCKNGFLFSVDDMVLYRNDIHIGSCFTRQELDCIYKQSETAKAVDKCYTLLSFRMHSSKELVDKLSKKFDRDTAVSAVEKMLRQGLVDDEKFALLKAEYMLNIKKYSPRQAVAKLGLLGIDRETAQRAVNAYRPEDMPARIARLIEKKYISKISQPEKIVASLVRKGYNYSDIKAALNLINIDLQEY